MAEIKNLRLQIDPRCIKCGRLPSAETALLEMQNHLYICNSCRHEEEQKGKSIAWANGAQPAQMALIEGSLTDSLPRNNFFRVLNVSTHASISEIETALGEQMRRWMFEPDSDEKREMIERLRHWQEEIVQDPQFLSKQRAASEPARSRGSALNIGGKPVYTATEFVEACEGSAQGWQDGEQLLRKGELQSWILFQLENRGLAAEAKQLARSDMPNFRALNHILYLLEPRRPFRLYAYEVWEPVNQVPHAANAQELVRLCDQYWERGEYHLYTGSMLTWLERTQGFEQITSYYKSALAGYRNAPFNQSLGLELLLEYIVPELPPPQLKVTFDGNTEGYFLHRWDRELPHLPVTIEIENITRGFVSATIELRKDRASDPDWLHLEDSGLPPVIIPREKLPAPPAIELQPIFERALVPVPIRGRPGTGFPARKQLFLCNLHILERGKTYRQKLHLVEQREFGKPPTIHEYPLTISTMTYLQGLRGKLWRWGLRGNLPGLLWNFAAGAVLSSIMLLLFPFLMLPFHMGWHKGLNSPARFDLALQATITGAVDLLAHLNVMFILMVGLLAGAIGLFTGLGKGHADYTIEKSAQTFRKAALRSSFFLLVFLAIWKNSFLMRADLSEAYQFWYFCGVLLVAILAFITLNIVNMLRTALEKHLRQRYAALLNPPGKG
jgi:hypothetical protein